MLQKEEKRKHALKIFDMIKRRESIVITDRKTRFSETEIRLMSELYLAKVEKRQVISSQLAKRLGLTRAAVSQIVQKLERERMVVRTPAPDDKKIAYVDLTQEAINAYRRDEEIFTEFIGAIVEKFGETRFETMYALYTEFVDLVQKSLKEKKNVSFKRY